MLPACPEPFWFRACGAWALGVGLDLTSDSPACFKRVWMTSRSSMKLMTPMISRHFGQVRGSSFPKPVGDRLRSSGSVGPSFSGIPSNFYRLLGCRGPGRLRFLFAFPGGHSCSNYSTGASALPCPACRNTRRPDTPGHQSPAVDQVREACHGPKRIRRSAHQEKIGFTSQKQHSNSERSF